MRFSSDVDTGSNYPGAQLFFVSLEQIAYQTFIETLADHDKPELIVVTEVDQIAVNDPRAGLLYYLAGWLLFRVKRYALNTDMGAQSDFLKEWVHNNQLDMSAASLAKLPISIVVERRTSRGNNGRITESSLWSFHPLSSFNLPVQFNLLTSSCSRWKTSLPKSRR